MVYDRLINVIAEKIGISVNDLALDTKFKEDLGVDSLDLAELIQKIENEFGEEVPLDRIPDMKNIEDVLKLLRELGVEE